MIPLSTSVPVTRIAARTLAKSPGFTAMAMLALALGIGANTAIFTVVNGVLLRPLPFPHAERIMRLVRGYRGGITGTAATATKFLFWRDHNHAFEAVAAYDVLTAGYSLKAGGEAEG